jgi:hypothetical protein
MTGFVVDFSVRAIVRKTGAEKRQPNQTRDT